MNPNGDANKIMDYFNFSFDINNIFDISKYPLIEVYVDAIASSIEYYSRLNSAFIDALSVPFKDAREEIKEIRKQVNSLDSQRLILNYNDQKKFFNNAEKLILSKIRNKFDSNFRENTFVTSLSEYVDSYCNLAKVIGAGQVYQHMLNLSAFWNNTYIEPIRNVMYRTPSHKIYSENNYSLFHYHLPQENNESRINDLKNDSTKEKLVSKTSDLNSRSSSTSPSSATSSSSTRSTPLLFIYAFINRNYILDLLPNSSIIRNFQKQGFDVFATDWGTPSAYDKDLTLEHYVNKYLSNAIDYIRTHAKSEKVSILGYCWGGDLALMLASLHPEKIQNIVTFATPGDFTIDNNLLSVWTRNINADSLVDAFGNAPGMFINSAFLLRSPIDFLHKYPHFFLEDGGPKDMDSLMQFMATEVWLYDSPPIIGEIYRQFVNDCYKKNLLIKNKLTIGDNNKIDLSKINHPFLNVIASRDDLVAPESSRALNEAIGSADKSTIEFNSGHVGACISSRAHQELWPNVGKWLRERSD